MTDGTDFQNFFPQDLYKGAFYMRNPNTQSGISKVVVDENSDFIIENTITTNDDNTILVKVKDENTGVFHDRNTPDLISVFNPSTMSVSGSISMSSGHLPGGEEQRYHSFSFRDDYLYASIRQLTATPYDPFTMHVADVSSGTYVTSTSSLDSGAVLPLALFGQNDVDESGNLYPVSQSDITTRLIPSRLFRINAGSNQIDNDYTWYPAKVLNPALFALPSINAFRYVSNGQAVALVNSSIPQEVIDIVTEVNGIITNLSSAQLDQINELLNAGENAQWCVIDVNAKTVTPISGIPNTSLFSRSTRVTEVGDKIYIPITNNSETAFYSVDVNAASSEKAFDVTGGAIQGLYNLGDDH